MYPLVRAGIVPADYPRPAMPYLVTAAAAKNDMERRSGFHG